MRSRTNDTVVVSVKERVGFERKPKSDRTLTLADWSALQQAIIRSGFWRMPDWHGQDGLDVWTWAIEGRRDESLSEHWIADSAKERFPPHSFG